MSTLLTTLPGDIPGLLRRGSPCIRDGFRAVLVRTVYDGLDWVQVALDDEDTRAVKAKPGYRCWLQLDLTDPTARAHAAWWCSSHGWGLASTCFAEDRAVCLAEQGADMIPEQIDTLARLVLRLAGRAP